MLEDIIAKRAKVQGVVQGVGFRPFVYQLAKQYGMKGEVANTSSGVSIHIEGTRRNIDLFFADLLDKHLDKHPPLSHITDISIRSGSTRRFKDFSIIKSKGDSRRAALISPDMAICNDCLAELFNPTDRRYRYPFINCTNCGPRYTIIDDIPYDRPKTSMKHFNMCSTCRAEYEDPGDRRFHAQPNACHVCGPHVALYDTKKRKIDTPDPVEKTAFLLKEGWIIGIKGLGGFHLAVDAENHHAVLRLRQRKHREEKPLAVMSLCIGDIRTFADVDAEEEELLASPQRPIVLLRKKEPGPLSTAVSPRNRYIGAMLPYTPLHYLLLNFEFAALVMTSGNMSEEPIAIENEDAFERLSDIADYLLLHNRDIYLRSDDSVVKRTAGAARYIRRSRGYIPMPVFLKKKMPHILACGAELKNTVCLAKGNHAFVSQHIGDLENLRTYDFFQMTIEHMKRILDITPEIVAYDLHPDYLSTRYALELDGIRKIPVQHHHAHIVSCMAENHLDEPVIGLSFDGTGYGTDRTVWGGEVLISEVSGFSRAGHLSWVPMPGSAAAVKEPWRMAVSYLYEAFGEDLLNLDLPVSDIIDKQKIQFIIEMIQKKINSPLTSSLGRFFDGVSAIIGIRHRVGYEGQAAMELEMAAGGLADASYEYEWVIDDGIHKVLPAPIIRGCVRDLKKGVSPSEISAKFHTTLIRLFSELCETLRTETGIGKVVLGGGVFQNSLLLTGIMQALEAKRFTVYTHTRVPTNDGGISLGQAVTAAAVSRK